MTDTITTKTGVKIPGLKLKPSMIVDRTLVLYGPSGSGKTVFVKNIMKEVQPDIPQILVVSPTEPANRSYEGWVEKPLVHYRLWLPEEEKPGKQRGDDGPKGAIRFLTAVVHRQEMMSSIYTRANDLKVLMSLFQRLPASVRNEGIKFIVSLNNKRTTVVNKLKEQYGSEPGKLAEKTKEIDAKFKDMLALLYKKYITPHHADLSAARGLTEDERYSLNYLHFNPRMLLIFDDCAAELKPLFNKEIFRKVFYQGRHAKITTIICCQDDTDLPTNLRKNAFVSFFMTDKVCRANFERGTNKFSKDEKEYANDVIPNVFQGHRKLAYIREDDKKQHFYHISVSVPKPFKFGSAAVNELCAAVRSDGTSMDKDNPYFHRFKL